MCCYAGHHDLDSLEFKNFHLDHFMWKATGDSKEEHVRIYEESAPKWNTIAASLGLNDAKINNIQSDHHSNVDRVRAVYREWLDNTVGLPSADKYPLSWSGLIRLLGDSQLQNFAKTVEKALLSPYNVVKGNL